jgi:hypothetical protein
LLQYSAKSSPLALVESIFYIHHGDLDEAARASSDVFEASEVHFVREEQVDLNIVPLGLGDLFAQSPFLDNPKLLKQAATHFHLWRHIAECEDTGLHLILSDGVSLAKDFVDSWNSDFVHSLPQDGYLFYLGGVLPENMQAYKNLNVLTPLNAHFAAHNPTRAFEHTSDPLLDHIAATEPRRRFHYAPVAYLLSKMGAQMLANTVRLSGFRNSVDYFLMKMMDMTEKVFVTQPHLAFFKSQNQAPLSSPEQSTVQNQEADSAPEGQCTSPSCLPLDSPSTAQPESLGNGASSVRLQAQLSDPNKVISTLLGPMRFILVSLGGHFDSLLQDAEKSLASARLPYTLFSEISVASFPLEGLIQAGALDETAREDPLQAARAVSYVSLFDELISGDVDVYLIMDNTVQIKHFFLEALPSISALVPQAWDVLFLDCPRECRTKGRVSFSPASMV